MWKFRQEEESGRNASLCVAFTSTLCLSNKEVIPTKTKASNTRLCAMLQRCYEKKKEEALRYVGDRTRALHPHQNTQVQFGIVVSQMERSKQRSKCSTLHPVLPFFRKKQAVGVWYMLLLPSLFSVSLEIDQLSHYQRKQ